MEGCPLSPPPGGPPGSSPSFPLHAQTSAKAETQTSSPRTCSTVVASPRRPALGSPIPQVQPPDCVPRAYRATSPRSTRPTRRQLPPPSPGPSTRLARGCSYDHARTGRGGGGRSPGARRVPRASHPAPGGSRVSARVFFSAGEGSPGSSRRRPPPLP